MIIKSFTINCNVIGNSNAYKTFCCKNHGEIRIHFMKHIIAQLQVHFTYEYLPVTPWHYFTTKHHIISYIILNLAFLAPPLPLQNNQKLLQSVSKKPQPKEVLLQRCWCHDRDHKLQCLPGRVWRCSRTAHRLTHTPSPWKCLWACWSPDTWTPIRRQFQFITHLTVATIGNTLLKRRSETHIYIYWQSFHLFQICCYILTVATMLATLEIYCSKEKVKHIYWQCFHLFQNSCYISHLQNMCWGNVTEWVCD